MIEAGISLSFIYCDAHGEITFREILNATETADPFGYGTDSGARGVDYIQGFCKERGALRTFKKSRILEIILDPTNAGTRLQFFRDNPPYARAADRTPRKQNNSNLIEVCFTGFKAKDKADLVSIAEASGMFVRSGVTENLSILCGGYNAGPAKMEEARARGVLILNEQQFREMIETGELPES